MKFVHIADIHNRNYQRHDQYKIAFSKTYDIIKEEKPDVIVICGDIAHTKTELSPEYISLSSDFIKNLSLLAPRIDIILGNHDGNLKNKDRENAIAPLVKNLDLKNVFLHKKSGIVDIDNNFQYAIFSCWDEENFPKIEPNDKITIALFHGAVDGCKPDNYDNILVDHKIILKSNYPLSLFNNCDYLLAGDIHKAQSLDKEGRFAYAGSLIQQNVGESTDKGFYVWDIKSKQEFSKTRKNIYVPGMWSTLKVDNSGNIAKNFDVVPESTIRLHYNSDINKQLLIDTVSKLSEVNPTCKIETIKNTVSEINTIKLNQTNDIKSYLSEKKISDDVIEKVTKLDIDIKSKINFDDANQGLIWQLLELEWSNLFSYGEDNRINLENLSGLIGIFGPNGIGKSSIIYVILWVMWGKIIFRTKSNHWIIRDGAKEAKASITIKANNEKIYKITRLINRKGKNKKDTSQSSVEFSCTCPTGTVENLNGVDRVDTDRNIRQIFGTIDDFIMTSMVPAGMMNNFVNNIGSERFDLLSTFLGIGSFKLKHEAAKKMSSDLQHKIKATKIDFDKEIQENNAQVIKYEVLCDDFKRQLDEQKQKSKELNDQVVVLSKEITKVEAACDYDTAVMNLSKSENTIQITEERLDELYRASGLSLGKIYFYDDKINNSLDDNVIKIYSDAVNTKKDFDSKYSAIKAQENILSSSLKILDEVPCSNRECVFIKDAYNKKDQYEILHSQSYSLMKDIKIISVNIESLSVEYDKYKLIQDQNNKYGEEKVKFINLYRKSQTSIIMSRSVLDSAIKDMETWKERVKISEKQKEIFEYNKQLERDIERISIDKSVIDNDIDVKTSQYTKHLELFGQFKFKLEDSQKKKQEWITLNDEYAAYDEYIKLTSRDGLPLSIVIKNLGCINSEIKTILENNHYDFSMYFQSNEDNDIEIFFEKDKIVRHLEVASESQKYVCSFLIRLALIQICSLPKPSMLWLDETFGALDESYRSLFMNLLSYIRSQFSHVFVITHIDSAKELVDSILDIIQEQGISKCYN
ncbi:MAG: AAA family ATPase [Candidatus Pacearchaeota archaeon]